MKLLVRNLPRTTTQDELKALFEQYGAVVSCNLVMDEETGRSKGFGFVEMPEMDDAVKAIQELDRSKIEKEKIRVKEVTYN
ncbi:RNA recognition motif containing protein [Vibrio sp. 10N.286.49.B3]|uniref:RNA recognition motif domain-containing protein n=1 Tax=Vibrio sp. 10N.286.49.B3 TaxID=1880855 RepID=UPI000C852492|nr:RNA recognition motif containing protein [Vibrio sp. 10N.286.49.B3]PMH43141.1 RNA recognition motif containing protein [Vibrio sp. 10N.286.49.B3]